MDSIVEAKVKDFLVNEMQFKVYDCGTILECIAAQAQAAGFDVDERFAQAGLGAGPEARVASRIVGRALGERGDETSDYSIRKEVETWIRLHPRKGR